MSVSNNYVIQALSQKVEKIGDTMSGTLICDNLDSQINETLQIGNSSKNIIIGFNNSPEI